MSVRIATLGLTVVVGVMLVSLSGCSKKSIQSGGDTQAAERGMAKSGSSSPPSSGGSMPGGSSGSMGSGGSGGMGSSGSGGMGSTFPDLSLSSKAQDPDSSVLKGFDSVAEGKSPSEERLGGGGTMLAKVEPSESSERQVEEIRREQAQEQAASAQAGLNDVFFGYDSWNISEDGRQALMQDAQWIKSNSGAIVKIERHSDERGTVPYNQVVGENRAKSELHNLGECGISAHRLTVVSYGRERPICNEQHRR